MSDNITFWNHWGNQNNMSRTREKFVDRIHTKEMAIKMSISRNYLPVRFWNGTEYEVVVAIRGESVRVAGQGGKNERKMENFG